MAEASSDSSVAGNVRSETRMKPAMFVLPPPNVLQCSFFFCLKRTLV